MQDNHKKQTNQKKISGLLFCVDDAGPGMKIATLSLRNKFNNNLHNKLVSRNLYSITELQCSCLWIGMHL